MAIMVPYLFLNALLCCQFPTYYNQAIEYEATLTIVPLTRFSETRLMIKATRVDNNIL